MAWCFLKHYGQLFRIFGSHGSEDVTVGLASSNTVWTCRWMTVFLRNILSPALQLKSGDSMILQNVAIYVQIYTALLSRRPTVTFTLC
jgi:hypothetical protein